MSRSSACAPLFICLVFACSGTIDVKHSDGGIAPVRPGAGGQPVSAEPDASSGGAVSHSGSGSASAGAAGGPLPDGSSSPSLPDAGVDRPRPDYPAGAPGCGLSAAAFCDTFDEIAATGLGEGRAGELEPRRWSGARMQPGLNFDKEASAVLPATIPACRPGLPAKVFPGQDALVCDGNDRIHSRHLLMAAAEQSYGQLSLRVRQPFDFRDRTGTIVFDVEGEIDGFLQGWPSIAITEAPTPAPSFAVMQNFENGAVPRAGLEVHFMQICGADDRVGVHLINVFRNLEERFFYSDQFGREPACVLTERGALNHFEVRVSRTRVEVRGTDRSSDGATFGTPRFLMGIDIELPFERGYVHITTHNHSSLKYSDGTVDAWTARWDNVGFDGPVIGGLLERSVPDSLDALVVDGTDRRNIGYQLGDLSEGPRQTLSFADVNPEGVTVAHLAMNGHFNTNTHVPVEEYRLRYRVNGHPWREYRFDAEQLALLHGPNVFDEAGENVRGDGTGIAGAMALWLPVEPAQLRAGTNELQFVTSQIPTGYRAYVANVDLVLERP